MQETKMPRNKETQKRKLRSRLHPARGLIKKDCAVMVTTQKQQPTNNNREVEDPTIQNCVSSLLNVKQNRTEPEPYTAITISDSLFFSSGCGRYALWHGPCKVKENAKTNCPSRKQMRMGMQTRVCSKRIGQLTLRNPDERRRPALPENNSANGAPGPTTKPNTRSTDISTISTVKRSVPCN